MRDPVQGDWELPGGIVEPSESLGSARCEVREELGVDLDIGRLLIVDWMPPYLGWDDAIEMIFDGGGGTGGRPGRLVVAGRRFAQSSLRTLDVARRLITPLAPPAHHRTWSARRNGVPGEWPAV